MKINNQLIDDLYWDGEDAFQYLPNIKGMPQRRKNKTINNVSNKSKIKISEIFEQMDNLEEYNFSYKASRHEEWWLVDALGSFYTEQWFDDVTKIVKGGKEASVYLCKANPTATTKFIAAKVYRPRSLRNLRKDHIYREGRAQLDTDGLEIIDERQQKAIRQKTEYGQRLMHTSWIEHEFKTLHILSRAGCDVPKPFASGHNAILMEFIGDEQIAAPTLNSITLEREEAEYLFEQVLWNINLMLDNKRVHGDLSAYNILYYSGNLTIIDFPQSFDPNQNPNAFLIFQRDFVRICEYFSSQGVRVNSHTLAKDIWLSHGFSTEPNMLWEDFE